MDNFWIENDSLATDGKYYFVQYWGSTGMGRYDADAQAWVIVDWPLVAGNEVLELTNEDVTHYRVMGMHAVP